MTQLELSWPIATAAAAELRRAQYSSSFLTAVLSKRFSSAVCWWWSHTAHARMTDCLLSALVYLS